MHIDEKHGSAMMGIMSDLMGSLEKRNLEVGFALIFEIYDEIYEKNGSLFWLCPESNEDWKNEYFRSSKGGRKLLPTSGHSWSRKIRLGRLTL